MLIFYLFLVYLRNRESWIEFALNETETKYLVDIQISLIEIPFSENIRGASIFTIFADRLFESSLGLFIQANSNEGPRRFEYVATYGRQEIPFGVYHNDFYHEFKVTDVRLVLSRFHLTVHYAESSLRVQLLDPVSSFNLTTLLLGSKGASSLVTCYESLVVNEQRYIQNDIETLAHNNDSVKGLNKIDRHCSPLNPCYATECPEGSDCVEADNEAFCVENAAKSDVELQGDSSGTGGPRRPTTTQILKALNVDEGSKVKLEVSEINIPEGILTKNIFFNVTRSGLTSLQHGTVINKNNKKLTIFNFEPARAGNIFYKHDGGENSNDKIVMQMIFRSPFNTFKPGNYVYVPVTVNPINDEPTLFMDWNVKFMLERDSMRELTIDVLDVKDSDDTPEDLKLFVMSSSQQFSEVTIVRKFQQSTTNDLRFDSVSTFTYQNIIEHSIFVKHESKNFGTITDSVRIELQVADLKSFGNKTFLHVEIVDVKLHVINERLLTIIADSSLILSDKLISVAVYPESDSLFVNADQGRLRYLEDDITLKVMTARQNEIEFQVLDQLGRWNKKVEFLQGQLRNSQVRIVSLVQPDPGSNVNGVFDVLAKYKSQQKFFRISYMITLQSFDVTQNNYFVFGSDVFSKNITGSDLYARLFQPHPSHTLPPNEVIYTLTSLPEYSYVYLNKSDSSILGLRENVLLTVGSNFTQSDLNEERIFLRRRLQALTSVTDQFKFTVKIDEMSSNNFTFLVHVTAIRNSNFRFHQKTLNVREGKQVVLTNSILSVSCSFSDNFFFYIIDYPKHGQLEVVGTRMKTLVAFTYSELKRGVVSYIHDDSESLTDEVKLLLSPITIPLFTSDDGTDYTMPINNVTVNLNISVSLVPDNRPEVVNNQVINTTYTGKILVTSSILKCSDPDIDQSDSNISYIVRLRDPALKFMYCISEQDALTVFTQGDIDDLKICFRQNADMPTSESVIRATSSDPSDQNIADEILITIHIRIVEPYLIAQTIKDVYEIEKKGKLNINSEMVQINCSFFLDPFLTMIAFRKPIYGKIVNNSTVVIQEFSYYDFLKGSIFYDHSSSRGDVFETLMFTVYAGDYQTSFSMKVRIIDDMLAPQIVTLQTLFVIEGSQVAITDQVLKSVQSANEASELFFLIIDPPKFGDFMFASDSARNSIFRFSQQDVYLEKVIYRNIVAGIRNDSMLFNVSNSDRTVGPYELTVVILPPQLSLVTTDVQIGQGKVFRLRDFVSIDEASYEQVVMNVEVTQYPFHGQFKIQPNASKFLYRSRCCQFLKLSLEEDARKC